jgi:hypothetical protein
MTGLQRRNLGLAVVLGSTFSLLCCQPAGLAGGFGRWQSWAQQCSFQRGPAGIQARRCQVVRLEQNLEGLLSVHFLADGSGTQVLAEQLVFAGVLGQGQRPMHCSSDGRCRPRWPTRLAVATVAATSFDGRGLATTMPHTLLARGECDVQRTVVRCQARNNTGEVWSAQAQL